MDNCPLFFYLKKTDINSNMRPAVTLNHPFLNGCKNLPTDRSEELEQMKLWMQTQPHLPPLKGRYHAGMYSVIRFRFSDEVRVVGCERYLRSKPTPSHSHFARRCRHFDEKQKRISMAGKRKGRRMFEEESG
ncbi:hypothetical protein RUM44_012321 [Polyplax serrata]|uniref:Uncharacterized protein n=1 Tax=Polyplax serrata TaxID=468196 RepID=A0ABR1BFE2_POLSC